MSPYEVVGDTLAVGDAVYYVLLRGGGRSRPVYWAAHVTRLTSRRVVIRLVGQTRLRAVLPTSVTKTQPPADADVWRDLA